MRTPLQKASLLILAILVLPVFVFSLFEIGNFRQNEKIIQFIYHNQLDAILFSINQYSDDLIGNLASRMENLLNAHKPDENAKLSLLLQEMPPVLALWIFDNDLHPIKRMPEPEGEDDVMTQITEGLRKNSETLKRLQTYWRGGYRKIESLGGPDAEHQWLVFFTHVDDQDRINVLVIDPEKFISQLLDPKMQEIARGKFRIEAYHTGDMQPFYASDKVVDSGRSSDRKPFWLLKGYQMGIELKDITIADLAKARMRRNLLLIGILEIVLISGAWLIIRNVSKQMELAQLKSDFVSNVSHEIRTPLALISMYIETLEMGRVMDPAKVQDYYGVILQETSRLSAMVNRFLNFSQIENGKRKYVFTEVDINEVAGNALHTFGYTLENKGFQLTFKPEPVLPVVRADREAIADALVNLIDNAIKYSPEGKNIGISTGKTDGFVFVEVEDHGIGIAEKDQRFIFDKFYRVTEKNLANRVKGSGLGLAIVKHIMDAHAGKIFLKSSPGNGSIFRLLFPVNN